MTTTPRLLLVLLLTSGCATVGPDYAPPTPETGAGWSRDETPVAVSAEELGRWWQRFGDATLDRLIEASLARNPSVREAAAGVAEARALRDWTAGRKLPEASATGSVTERRQSENGSLPIDRIPGLERDQAIFEAGFDASWEIDIFGRTRRSLEAAEARFEGAREAHRAASFSVAAEVARVYFGLREGQRRLAALEASTGSSRATHELVALRVAAGEVASVELSRAEADLRLAESRLPAQRADLRASALALAVLTGRLPETELALLDESPPALELAPFPLGERADLLRRRPDVAAAERQLAAATADIGIATAELYPRLAIGARGGFQSLDAAELLDAASATWSLVPSISWRVFDGGRVQAEIRLAEARAGASAAAWEATVLEALGDAERALALYRGGLDALGAEEAAVESARRTRDLEKLRHDAGETSLLVLLDAERRLDDAEAALATTRSRAATDLVSLIKALGGGWSA